ncbi:MAG TPA: helix-turn-helix domain-containing protein [Muribaculaceae bacterium]|nr:helix-turn-helix domain-containing protein [Muribaculaceae bacterium]
MSNLQTEENIKKFAHMDNCPIRNVVSRFSGKWALLILCLLSENGKTRFSTIGKALPDISPKVLSTTLKGLEADGLVNRKIYPEIPPRVEYSLSATGLSLMPIVGSLISWASENYDNIVSARANKKQL